MTAMHFLAFILLEIIVHDLLVREIGLRIVAPKPVTTLWFLTHAFNSGPFLQTGHTELRFSAKDYDALTVSRHFGSSLSADFFL